MQAGGIAGGSFAKVSESSMLLMKPVRLLSGRVPKWVFSAGSPQRSIGGIQTQAPKREHHSAESHKARAQPWGGRWTVVARVHARRPSTSTQPFR